MSVRARSLLHHAISALLCLAMLHLNLVGSELLPCTAHGTAELASMSSAPMRGMDAGHRMTMAHSGHEESIASDVTTPRDSSAPAHAVCCDGSAPCGPLAIVSQADDDVRLPFARAIGHAEPGELRVSLTSAPEPPPPKA